MARRQLTDFGYSLFLDGTDDSFTVPVTPATTGFTIAIRFKLNVNNSNGRIVDWQAGGPTGGFTIVQGITGPRGKVVDFVVNNGGSETCRIRAFIPTEEWTDYVVTYSPTDVKVYVDNVLAGTDSSAVMTTAATTLAVGKRATAASNFVKMKLKRFAFDNGVAWSTAQIQEFTDTGTVPSTADVHYGFNQNVLDSSGNGNNATLSGGAYRLEEESRLPLDTKSDYALNFSNGTTHKVTVADASEIQPEGNYTFTWSQWLYAYNTRNNLLPRVIEKGDHYTCIMGDQTVATVGNCFALEIGISGTDAVEYWSSTRIQLNRWYFIATTFDHGTVVHYINGAPDVTQVINNPNPYSEPIDSTSGSDLIIGNSSGNNRNWPGLKSDVRYHNRVLSQSEILDLMFGREVRNGLVEENLMTEGTGSSVSDTSGNGNTGTITGAPWVAQIDTRSAATVRESAVRVAVS